MKIRKIEVFAVDLPMSKTIKMALEVISSTANALVRVETDDGYVGWGDAPAAPTMTGETIESMVAAIRYLAPRLTGMPLNPLSAVLMRADLYLFGNNAAKSAIDMALHDALGRATKQSVSDLLGGRKRDRIPLLRQLASGSIDADVEEAKRRKAQGFVVFKIKVGANDLKSDIARTRAVSAAVGGAGILLCADANQGWSVKQSIEYVVAVEDTALEFLEQPVPSKNIQDMVAVARASRIKLCCDEGLHSFEDINRYHKLNAAQGVNLKTIKLGGVQRVYDAAVLCDQLGMRVNLACKMAGCGVTCAALTHIAAAIPNVDWGMSLTVQYLADDVLAKPLDIAGGHVSVPEGYGLGVSVDEDKVRHYARSLQKPRRVIDVGEQRCV